VRSFVQASAVGFLAREPIARLDVADARAVPGVRQPTTGKERIGRVEKPSDEPQG
jgi:hypothetical protein